MFKDFRQICRHRNFMTKSVFIASAEPFSGKSIVALGLINLLLAKAKKVGYFKPVINTTDTLEKDVHIHTILKHFDLPVSYENAFAFSRAEAMQLLETENRGALIDKIISRYKSLEDQNDFTLIEGSDFLGEGSAFEMGINATIAKNLNAPAIIVSSGKDKSIAQIINSAVSLYNSFVNHDIKVLGLVMNKVEADQCDDVYQLLKPQLPDNLMLSVIPAYKDLNSPTMQEILDAVEGKLLFGKSSLSNQVDNFITGAMQVPSFLKHLKPNVLIVTPGDRGDIIVASLQANLSASYPRVAGIVLTANVEPEEPITKLIEGLDTVVPIIAVSTGTFETINRIGNIQSRIAPDNKKKIQLAIDTFNKHVDTEKLLDSMVTYQPDGMTPYMFLHQLGKRAKSSVKHIVLPEGNDDRILKAAARLAEQGMVRLTLLGDEAAVSASFKRLGLTANMDAISVIDPIQSSWYEEFAETLCALRKSKNMALDTARDLMTDVSYFGTMMVYKGLADGMVSGANHTTQHTIRPALQFVKTKPGTSIVSSVFFMCLPDRVCVFGDCAVNPNPNAEELAEIAINSADSSRNFGIEPLVAMLSYSSGSSGEGEQVEKVRKATAIVKQKRPDLKIEGPIQYDAAVDLSVGRQKLPDSLVAGRASVLIFPDLNTGNNTYKAVQRETGALAVGPMLQGLNKPVNDLSRGCTVEDIYNTVIITAIQAQELDASNHQAQTFSL